MRQKEGSLVVAAKAGGGDGEGKHTEMGKTDEGGRGKAERKRGG